MPLGITLGVTSIMKISVILAAIAAVAVSSSAMADTYVRGHMRNNGTYVQPHYRSNADGWSGNNYSTRGNVNPYTGRSGTHSPSYGNPSYGRSNSYGGNSYRSNSYGGSGLQRVPGLTPCRSVYGC